MTIHKAVELVIERIEKDLIGGAADTAIELMDSIGQLVADSPADTPEALYAEMDEAGYALLKICPSFAPPINVLHMMFGSIERDMDKGASLAEVKENLAATRAKFHKMIKTAFSKMADVGAELIKDGDHVFMFSMSSSAYCSISRGS